MAKFTNLKRFILDAAEVHKINTGIIRPYIDALENLCKTIAQDIQKGDIQAAHNTLPGVFMILSNLLVSLLDAHKLSRREFVEYYTILDKWCMKEAIAFKKAMGEAA